MMAITGLTLFALVASGPSFARTKPQIDASADKAIAHFYRLNPKHKELADKAAGILIFGRVTKGGVACGDETGSLAVAHQAKADAQGRVAFAAHRLRRLLLHADDFTSVDDANGEPAPEGVQVELAADHVLFAHQQDFHVIVTSGENGAFHFGFGRAIRAHGVNSNSGGHVCLSVANLRNRQTGDTVQLQTARVLL